MIRGNKKNSCRNRTFIPPFITPLLSNYYNLDSVQGMEITAKVGNFKEKKSLAEEKDKENRQPLD